MLHLHSLIVICLFILSIPNNPSFAQSEHWQGDFQGDFRYSHRNFTDLDSAYESLDLWTEGRLTYWLNKEKKQWAAFANIIPVASTHEVFWWQRNVQVGGGIQYYPGYRKEREQSFWLNGLRLFVWGGRRFFYCPQTTIPDEHPRWDLQVGSDFYNDNLFNGNEKGGVHILWSRASWQITNFSLPEYYAFLWTGNAKWGHKHRCGKGLHILYGVADWTWVPQYEDRFWENFVRLGAGYRWYPFAFQADETYPGRVLPQKNGILSRFHLYAEGIANVWWIKKSPEALGKEVHPTDFRVGIGFSTGGLFRLNK